MPLGEGWRWGEVASPECHRLAQLLAGATRRRVGCTVRLSAGGGGGGRGERGSAPLRHVSATEDLKRGTEVVTGKLLLS